MTRIVAILAICFAGVFAQPAQAMWGRSESLEWWTNISDVVVVADVDSTKPMDPLNKHWKSQQVHCSTTTVLKGESLDSFTFRHDYRDLKHGEEASDAMLHPKTKLLLFYVHEPGDREDKVVFWVNLTKPDRKLADHAAYDNDCKWLEKSETIVDLVKARVANESPKDKTKKRGIIVPFTAAETQDMYWDFVRTADPEYKSVLLEQLRKGDRESAIYNLISYRGKETQDLIRPYLKDAMVQEIEIRDDPDPFKSTSTHVAKFYPLRQAAYLALTLLGDSPEKPEGYLPDQRNRLFQTGFEDRTYFPVGNWKRIEK